MQVVAAKAVPTVQTTHVIETTLLKFVSTGDNCKGRTSQVVSAYAVDVNNRKLNARYAIAQKNSDGLFEVTLTPAYDATGAPEDHAIYIRVEDATSALSGNLLCFMANKGASTADFCRTLCLEQQFSSGSVTRPEDLSYVVSTSSLAVTYTTEFSQIS